MESNFQNALTITIIGFSSVLFVLTTCAISIAALNKLNSIVSAKKRIDKNPKGIIATPAPESHIDDETIAIITAAIIATIDKNIVIKKISFMQNMCSNTAWSSISKTANFQSHNINVIKQRRKYNG